MRILSRPVKGLRFSLASAFALAMALPVIAQTANGNSDPVQSAQSRYQEIFAASATVYSAQLKKEEQELAGRMIAAQSPHNKIAILDPLKMDIGKALGLPDQMTIYYLLEEKGICYYPDLGNMIGNFMVSKTSTLQEKESFTQDPHTLFLMDDGHKGPCIIIPAPDNSIPAALKIPGFTAAQANRFANAHEGWHCLDRKYYTHQFSAEVYSSFDPKNLKTLIGNKDGLKAYSTLHKAEAFADVATLGDMVRSGDSMDVFDAVENWRMGKSEDLIHFSTPVLKALKREILSMGVNRFRQMKTFEAIDFYYTAVARNALSADSLQVKILYDEGDAAARARFETRAGSEAAVAVALQYKNFSPSLKTEGLAAAFTSILGGPGMTPSQIERSHKIGTLLADWDPVCELKARARKQYGSITPDTMIKAYISLRDEFSSGALLNPAEADLLNEKASLLKAGFVENISDMDYKKADTEFAPKISG